MLNTNPNKYNELGYYVASKIISGKEILQYRTVLDRMITSLKAGERPENMVEPHVHAPEWRIWLELCRHPKVLNEVRAVMGDELVLLMSHLIVKPAGTGKKVQWHQDNTYWHTVDCKDICTVWLAIDDSTKDNGCLRVIPNTHVGHRDMDMVAADGDNLLTVKVEVDQDQEAKALDIELKAGSLSIHDSFILHGSEPNTSNRRRAGYTMRYAKAEAVKVDYLNHGKPVYLVSGKDSSLDEGMRDLRPGRALPDHSGDPNNLY